MATGAEPTNLVQRTMSGSTRIRPSDCDPGALITDEYPGVNLPAGPPNACVTGWHAAASASASARLSATAAASAAACAAVSPGSASQKAHEAAEAAGAVAEAAAVAEAKAEAATVAWLARAAAEDAAGPTPTIQPPPQPPGAQKLPKDVRELPASKTSVYTQGELVSDGALPNGVGVESEEEAAAEEAARVAGTHAAAEAEAAKAERLSRARRQLQVEKARRESASAASAVAVAETEAAAAARLRDEANQSLFELQNMEAEATRAEKLAIQRGGSQKLAAGKAKRKSELSGAIKRLEAAAAAAAEAAEAASPSRTATGRSPSSLRGTGNGL